MLGHGDTAMRLVYFGSSPFGLPTLAALNDRHTLAAIVTQPPRPAGRGSKLTPTPVAQWASVHAPGTTIIAPQRVNDPAIIDQIHALHADAWVVIAFGQKLSRALLDHTPPTPATPAINLHASLLPRWRGAAPIHAAILAGDTTTGNSVITLADRMDAGLILAQDPIPIGPADTTGDLHDRLADRGPTLVLGVLDQIQAGTTTPIEQDESLVTLAPKLTRHDRWVDFNAPADRCRCRINAMSPRPSVTVAWRSATLKLLRAQVASPAAQQGSGAPVGTIIDPASGLVACGEGTVLQLLEVQAPSSRVLSWPDFARGQRVEPGEQLIGESRC